MLNRIQSTMPSNNQQVQKSQTKNKAQLVPFKENIKIVSNASKEGFIAYMITLLNGLLQKSSAVTEVVKDRNGKHFRSATIKIHNFNKQEQQALVNIINQTPEEGGIITRAGFVKEKK